MLTIKSILVLLLVSTLINAQAPETITFSGLFEITTFNSTSGTSSESTDAVKSMATAFMLAIDDINSDPFILPDSTLIGIVHDTAKTTTGALGAFVTSVTEEDAAVVIGPTYSDQATICAVASGIYDVMILSPTASLSALSSKSLYPLFGRSVPPDTQQSQAMIDFLRYYYNITAEPKWLNCSIISTADSYGVDGSRQFIASGVATTPNVTVLAYQQFLIGATDVSVEVGELQQSKTRVFIAYMYNVAFQTVLLEANRQKIIGDYFVWLCSDGCATDSIFQDPNGKTNKNYQKLSRGLTGFLPRGGTGIRYQEYLDRWLSLDPDQYVGAGTIPTVQSLLTYDTVYAAALSMHLSFTTGNYSLSGKQIFTSAGLVQFVGLTGFYDLTATGDRITDYEVVNVRPDYVFHETFTWNTTLSLIPVSETFWHDGTTNIPDLDVRTPFDYWSCDDKEAGTDSTGKTIKLEKVDGSDVNYIDADYECDQVIDCTNLSDEDTHCSPSLVAAYIACGIITGLMVFGLIALLPFIIIFGFIIRRGRIVLPGPLFLLIITLAGILGLISTYAWYGKAHTVACQFQLWLFGLACTALASAFFAKQIRIFREYEFPIAKVRKSQVWQKLKSFREVEFCLWFIICFLFPFLIFILWEAIATPIATRSEVNDEDHFVCNSGGVGRAGGVAFFFIFFGYLEALMIIGFIITFFTRKVPQPFMDKRLMTISIFNVIFVSAVIVGIYFVLYNVSPFAAWLIRTLAMMYLFFITPMIHMIPKLIGLILIDRFKQNKGNKDQQGPTPKKGGKDYDPSLSQSNTQSMGL